MMARVLVSPERIEYKAVENAELVGEWFVEGWCGVVGCVGGVERVADG